MTKISKGKWERLDELVKEIGFGGYYDLLECLKMAITNITEYLPEAGVENVLKDGWKQKLEKDEDLESVVQLLLHITTNIQKFEVEEDD